MYDERKHNLDEYINEANKIVRGYVLRSRNMFSVTKEGFVSATPPSAVGGAVGIGTGGKISTTVASGKTTLGTVAHIETNGRYTWYCIKIGKTEG